MMLAHILIVDDDVEICQLLKTYLEKNAYQVSYVHDAAGLWQCWAQQAADLVILDVMLPSDNGEDGLVLCRNLRAQSDVPIIILSALGEDMDRIIGMEMGADDYLPKPFNPRELLVRIKARLRRYQSSQIVANPSKESLAFADWQLDLTTRELHHAKCAAIKLSGAEFRLLQVFLSHPKQVLSRDQLLEQSQGREAQAFDRSVDVLVGRLRKHLQETKIPKIIQTERGFGYVLAAEVKKIQNA